MKDLMMRQRDGELYKEAARKYLAKSREQIWRKRNWDDAVICRGTWSSSWL
jgi:hypothetical protein